LPELAMIASQPNFELILLQRQNITYKTALEERTERTVMSVLRNMQQKNYHSYFYYYHIL